MIPRPASSRSAEQPGLRTLSVVLLLLGLLTPVASHAQGCVAVRGSGMCALHPEGVTNIANLRWQAFLGYRWLHSDRHFRGDHEEVQRQTAGTEVVNDSHFFDLGLSYAVTPRVAATLVIPFVRHDRSSLYEHSGNAGARYHTQSSGIGDIRFTLSSWLWDPVKTPDGNLQLGIGLKAPSGDYNARDTFITPAGPVVGFVDQSIQPGDGGWGFTLEANGYRALHPRWFLFGQAFYLFNPTDVNGTSTVTGRPRGNPFEQVMSVNDQYFGRAGVSFTLVPSWGLSLTLAGRVEGVPVRDLIGDSNGFRRPGFAVSIEPGLNWMRGSWNVALTTPVLAYANRLQSVADKNWTAVSGVERHGDAAFASFLVSLNVSRQF